MPASSTTSTVRASSCSRPRYAELDREDPKRQTAQTASFLQASLFTSVVAFGVAAMAIVVGVLFILIGLGIRDVASRIRISPAAARRPPEVGRSMRVRSGRRAGSRDGVDAMVLGDPEAVYRSATNPPRHLGASAPGCRLVGAGGLGVGFELGGVGLELPVSAYTLICRLAYGLMCRSVRASCSVSSS